MAYIYFTLDDHISLKHDSDVYLIGSSSKYTADNTYFIKDYTLNQGQGLTKGWNLASNLSISIGGVDSIRKVAKREDINQNSRTYSVFQSHYSSNIYSDMTEYSAIRFHGNGTLNLTAQTGDGSVKFNDNTIAIYAKNFSSTTDTMHDESKLENTLQPTLSSASSAINTDSYSVKADDTLNVATDFRGRFEAHSRAYSKGAQVNKTLVNTANNMSNKAAGFAGKNIIFNGGGFFGDVYSTSSVAFASCAARDVSNNIVGAYGVYAEERVDSTKSVWSGHILVEANSSVIDATKASGDGNALPQLFG